ncbi:glycosyltransferase family 4 protein [Formosa sp. S-31]|uniref:glycosyltransferase family 4 protein n=1 Tax=Formosa sp. S-31 TaxID=2790949 RepID=UPI003EB8A831
MKKILILGPFGDYGGRDVEVNIIAKALCNNYKVRIVSTSYMTNNSFALNEIHEKVQSSTLDKIITDRYRIIRILAFLNAFKNGNTKHFFGYASNTWAKRYFNYYKKRLKVLYDILLESNLVIMPVQLSSLYLKETILFCETNNIPILVRTTGTIFNVPKNIKSILNKVNFFIHHSKANARNLEFFLPHNYVVIDQCCTCESQLLKLKINNQGPLKFGFLGRLSEEKQIIPLTKIFIELGYSFFIAGDGPLLGDILKMIDKAPNVFYLGLVEHGQLADFFKLIDVLVVASKEETGPLVGLEAMAAGKIIVSTPVGAMIERLEMSNNSFWFSQDNLASIEQIIFKLNKLKGDAVCKIGLENRNLYLKQYSTHIIKREYQNIVSLVVNNA